MKQGKDTVAKGSEGSPAAREKRQQEQGMRPRQQPLWKRILLGLIVGASIVVVGSWAVFAVKPDWWPQVKGLIASPETPQKKKAKVRRSPRPVFKVEKTRKTVTRPPATPESGQGPRIAARMERPQPLNPEFPPETPSPSTTPITRPQVSVPGGVQRPAVTTPAPLPPLKQEESELDEYLEIGTLYAQKGDYQKAEELFQRVTKENPSSAQARNNLGFVYLKQDKYEQAEGEFKEALRINPAFVLPYYNLACLYSRKGMDVEALIYLKRALNRDARVKGWAATDEDFRRLRSDVVFQELVGVSPPKKTGTSRTTGPQKQQSTQKPELRRRQEEAQRQGNQIQEESLKKEEASQQEGVQQPERIVVPKRIPISIEAAAELEEVQTSEEPPTPVHTPATEGMQTPEAVQTPEEAQGETTQ